jgi:hypothetical protein
MRNRYAGLTTTIVVPAAEHRRDEEVVQALSPLAYWS